MSRFAISGVRAGETIHTAAHSGKAHAVDAGHDLTDDQRKHYEASGYTLTKVADVAPPVPGVIAPRDEVARQLIAENSAAAERIRAEATAIAKPNAGKGK
jgi:hypothetical protein